MLSSRITRIKHFFHTWFHSLSTWQKKLTIVAVALFIAIGVWKIAEAATSLGTISNSSTTNATQASTMRHVVRTSEGTLHAFVQMGTQTATCNGVAGRTGLVWQYSTNNGSSWTCGEQLSSDTTNLMFASATVDSSDNVYVVYSTATSTANSAFDVTYRKLTKGSGATWTVGNAQLVFDASSSTGYSYATLEIQGTTRLWVSARYFDGTNYQIPVSYSSDLTDNPTWTSSTTNLDVAGGNSSFHIPAMVRFGSKIGVIYNSQLPLAQMRWRVRDDADGLTSWSGENVVSGTSITTATFTAISDSNGNVYFAQNNGANVFFNYWNGSVWSQNATVTSAAASSAFVSLSTDGSSVWVFYGDTTGLSGSLSGSRKLAYKKGTLPFSTTEFDSLATNSVAYEDTFDKVWSFFTAAFTNVTTAAGNTTSADTQMIRNSGDILYFGKLQKFDSLSWDVSTSSTGGAVAWEYWNGSSWTTLNFTVSSNTLFQGDGWAAFTDPSDWATTTVNGEGTPYYYIRARVTTNFGTTPVGVQFAAIPLINWAGMLPAPVGSSIYGVWTENAASPIRIRSGAVSVSTTTANTASPGQLSQTTIGYSSTSSAVLPSTMRSLVRTSDGTLHSFIQAGQVSPCGGSSSPQNGIGLVWVYSTDNGANWTCGAQLTNNLSIQYYASAAVDASDNVYVVYSVATTGANASYDVFYQKLTKGSGSTWTAGSAQTVLDATPLIGYSYAVIGVEGSSRLWIATRYFDGTAYQVSAYYSNNQSDTASWTLSKQTISTSSTASSDHFPAIVRYGSNFGIVYNSTIGTNQRWRFRTDGDDLTTWSNESIVSTENLDSPTFNVVSDGGNNLYHISNSSTSIFFSYWNGTGWSPTATVSTTAASNTFASVVTDGASVWAVYSESTGISAGLPGIRRLVYKRGVAPFASANFDATATSAVSHQTTFDKYWSFVSSAFTNDTTDAASTTTADTQIVAAANDIAYFGKTEKFDTVAWDLSTLGVGGRVAWEYWNGSAWVEVTKFLGVVGPSFSADGYISFMPPSDWATTSVNGEGTPYYYVRARVLTSFTTTPVGVQLTALPLVSWAQTLHNPVSNAMYGLFTDGSSSPVRVRLFSNSIPAVTPNTVSTQVLNSVAGYSSTNAATQPSTMRHIVQTSDGTIHAFIQAGTRLGCGGVSSTANNIGLVWVYSSDEGANWTCGGQLSSDTTNLMYASAAVDSSDNVYVVYSVNANTNSSAYSVSYRKLTKGSGATWSLGNAQTALDASSGAVGYSYAVIAVDSASRLWLASRYYDGSNYQVTTYYSNNLSTAPTWTVSQATLDTANGSNVDHYPTIVKFGTKIGVVYNTPLPIASQRWRFRNDSDDPTSWSAEMMVSSDNLNNPTFAIISDSSGNVYHVSNNGTNIFFTYWNGVSWSATTTVASTTPASTAFVSVSTDGYNVWVFYGDTTGVSGTLPGTRRLVYKKGIAPYTATEWDTNPTSVVSYQSTFDKYWSYVGTTFTNDTSDSGNTTSADTQMLTNIGDTIYFGKTEKFDAVAWALSTNGTVGIVTWEYWNGSSWVPITEFQGVSNPTFTGSGFISFIPGSDWATTSVNGEGTPYYYVRARTTTGYSVSPVGIQMVSYPFIHWAQFLPTPASNKIFGLWNENNVAPVTVRMAALTVAAATPNTASSTDLLPYPNSSSLYSALTTATQVSTQRKVVITSDGTLHQFIQGSNTSVCGGSSSSNNLGGLVWVYSTDAGVTWSCGGQLWSDTTNVMYPSATVDSNNNIYVVYSQMQTGANAAYDVYYRKLTKGSGSTWTVEAQQIMLDSSSVTGYTYATIEVEGTDRLWVAVRYFDGTNYQVSTHYSSALTAAPTWTVSQLTMNTAGTNASYHYPAIVRFGTNIGVVYNAQTPATIRWRYRSDSDGVTTWNSEAQVSSSNLTTPTFSIVGDSTNVYVAMNVGTAVNFTYWNGSTWSTNAVVSSSAASNAFVSTSLVGSTVYVYYGDTTGLSAGLTGSRKLVYKRGVAPYATANFDASATSFVSHHGTFDKYWSFVSNSFTDDTTDAGSTANADTAMATGVGDMVYFGKSSKFDTVAWDLSTNGTTGRIAWEYYNGTSWVPLNRFLGISTPSFSADGYVTFIPPSDWATTSVNSEGSSYYYVRARVVVAFGTTPVGVQMSTIPQINWVTSIGNASNLYLAWAETTVVPMRVRFSAFVFNVAPGAPSSLGPSNFVDGSATSNTTPTLTFVTSDTNIGDTSSFTIQIDDSEDFGSPVVSFTSAQAVNGVRSFTVGQATGGGSYTAGSQGQTLSDANYYWRVLSTDAASLATSYTVANSGAIAFRVDNTAPSSNASGLVMLRSAGATEVPSNGWTNSAAPYFSWSAGVDANGALGSGVKGYCLYLGQDPSGDPASSKGMLGTSPVSTSGTTCQFIVSTTSIDFSNVAYRDVSWLTTDTDSYYLNIKIVDNVGKIFSGSSAQASFRYDDQLPTNVGFISPAGGTFSNVADMSFSWPTSGLYASSDSGPSGLLGWQYQINTVDGEWKGSTSSAELGVDYIPTGNNSRILTNAQDGSSIIPGNNTIYFRTIDQAGNTSSPGTYRTGVLQYGGAAPIFPPTADITVTPSTATENNFGLSWSAATTTGDSPITNYYYMVNITPPTTLATILNNPATFIDNGTSRTVSAGALPNVNRGSNTVYVVAVDEAGNYSPSNYISKNFTLNSTNPDNVGNLTASDSSIKSESRWMVTLTWTAPEYKGAGNLTYVVYRSTDGETFTSAGTTSSLSFVDSTEDSALYYYKVYSKDGANQLSSGTNAVSMTPTGRWTSAPTLDSGPKAELIKTKSATISWTTSRQADSKISYGTSKGTYLPIEPSSSTLSVSHTLNLSGLLPGTTYYYVAKWTDEDGNTGTSEEKSFTTAPAPTVTDPKLSTISLDVATLSFTVEGASKVKIFYGLTPAFGAIKDLSTSTSKSTYSVQLSDLLDGTKYYYKINTFDEDNYEYDGTALSFETLPRPKITNVRVQQVKNTAQPTVLITWTTNTAVSSIVTYYPVKDPGAAKDEINLEPVTNHRVLLRNLTAETPYELVVKGRDKQGNEGRSETQRFTTATDTRPPSITDLRIQGSTQRTQGSQSQVAQIVVTWNTDEASTTQVEYGEGTGTSYPQKTQEDIVYKSNHLVVISNLSPSKVYHLRAISKDQAGNPSVSQDNVTITPKETDSALDLVLNNLQQIFGNLGRR